MLGWLLRHKTVTSTMGSSMRQLWEPPNTPRYEDTSHVHVDPELTYRMHQAMQQANANAMMHGNVPQGGWATTQAPDYHQAALTLLKQRMIGVRGMFKLEPKDFLMCHLSGDTVYVFYVFGDRAGFTEEQVDIFPSDKLITQLRLVRP